MKNLTDIEIKRAVAVLAEVRRIGGRLGEWMFILDPARARAWFAALARRDKKGDKNRIRLARYVGIEFYDFSSWLAVGLGCVRDEDIVPMALADYLSSCEPPAAYDRPESIPSL